MTEIEDVWRRKNDDQLVQAFRSIDEYSVESQRALRAELLRRGLDEPSTQPITLHEAETVARLHRRFAALVAAQWLSLVSIVWFGARRNTDGPFLALVCAVVFLLALVAVPMTGSRLLRALGTDSARGTAFFMHWPLFSLVALLGMRSFNERWSTEHAIEVGLLGPTPEALQRLRDAERWAPR